MCTTSFSNFLPLDDKSLEVISSTGFILHINQKLFYSKPIWSSRDYPWWISLSCVTKDWHHEWISLSQGHFAWSNLELSASLKGTMEMVHGAPLAGIKQKLWGTEPKPLHHSLWRVSQVFILGNPCWLTLGSRREVNIPQRNNLISYRHCTLKRATLVVWD